MKKIFMFMVLGLVTSVYADKEADVALVLNPKCMCVRGLDLRGVNLAGQNLASKIFVSVDFRGTDLCGADCTDCYFIDCIFSDALVDGTIFDSACFIRCDLLKMLGKPKESQDNADPKYDRISGLTLQGKEKTFLYVNNGYIGPKIKLNISALGLCRSICDEAKAAATSSSSNQ